MVKKLLLILMVCSFCAPVFAKKARLYPKGCDPKNVDYEFDYLLLGTTPSERSHRVFVFKNITHSPVMLAQADEQNILGIQFNTVIQPDKWSALLSERPDFKLICKDLVGSEPWPIACHQVIRACELRVSPIMDSALGQYWITENNGSTRSLYGEIRGHGIYP